MNFFYIFQWTEGGTAIIFVEVEKIFFYGWLFKTKEDLRTIKVLHGNSERGKSKNIYHLANNTCFPFASSFIGNLYRFSIEVEAPTNGCGFLRPWK